MTALDQLQLVKLGEICHKNPISIIDASASLSDALSLMNEHRVSSLTVLKDGAVHNFLDLRDVMTFLACTFPSAAMFIISLNSLHHL